MLIFRKHILYEYRCQICITIIRTNFETKLFYD